MRITVKFMKGILGAIEKSIDTFTDFIRSKEEDIARAQRNLSEVKGMISETTSKIRNYVSHQIIDTSKLQKQMSNLLTVKRATNELAVNPTAGKELADKIALLDKKDKALDYDNLVSIIAEKFGETVTYKDAVKNDPARVLFRDNGKGGMELHPNVVGAISKSLIEYLLKFGPNMISQDPEHVAQMLGWGNNVEAMPKEALTLIGNKTFKKNVADSLGKTIANDLGLKIDLEAEKNLREDVAKRPKAYHPDTVVENMPEKFYASLGQIAAIIGGEVGIFTTVDNIAEENKLSPEQYASIAAKTSSANVEHAGIDMIGLGELGKKLVTSKNMYTTFNEIADEYTDGTFLKEVKTEPISEKKPVEHRVIAKLYNIKQQAKDIVNKGRQQAWRMDFAAIELFKTMEKEVKEHLGYVEATSITDPKTGEISKVIPSMSYVDEQNQLAKNNSIDLKLKLLDSLYQRIKDEGEDTDLFFEYFYGANGRSYLDNTEANPQNDKFNRFMLGLSSNGTEVDLSNENADSTKVFYIALAQAMGEGIDKMTIEDSVAKGKEWLAKGSEEIIKTVKEDTKWEPEAVGHTLQGILAVQAYEQSNGEPFETNLVIETDAVTSGIILKLLQLPLVKKSIEEVKNLLKRGGIIFEGDENYDDFENIGTNGLIGKGQLDLYRMLAQKYSGAINQFHEEEKWKVDVNDKTKTWAPKTNARRKRLLDVLANPENGIMPEFTTEEAKIKGQLRSIFKPVVMVFGYGGGITSIKNAFISNIVEEFPTKLLKEKRAVIEAKRKGEPLPKTPITDLLKALNPKIDFSINDIRTKDILDTKMGKNSLRDILVKDMVALYGDTLETALTEVFGPELVNANKTINNAFRMMFRIFNVRYQEKITEFKKDNGRNPSTEEKAEMLLDMQKEFPAIAPPFAKSNEKGIIVDQRISADTQIKAQTLGNFDRNGGQKSISVNAVLKEFEEAISAGNVVPIHYIDASIMGNTFLNVDGITQVFDAIVANLNNATEANADYNKQAIEVSRDYSLTGKVLESLLESFNTIGNDLNKDLFNELGRSGNETYGIKESDDIYLGVSDVIRDLETLHKDATNARDELFSYNIKSDHMTGLGAVVEIKGTEKTDKSLEQPAMASAAPTVAEQANAKVNSAIVPKTNKQLQKIVQDALKKECK